MTKRRTVVVLCGLCLAGAALSPLVKPPANPATATAGVIVEQVDAGGAAARAGIRRGDILQSWKLEGGPSKEASRGELRTPFDLWYVEVEQGPRGEVRLSGLRDNRSMTFSLAQQGWRIGARPLRPPNDAWRMLGDAESFDRNGKWTEAQAAYEAALRNAAGGDWWTRARLHDAYGAALLRRNEHARARAEYRKALELASRSSPDGLTAAYMLASLGAIEESVDNYAEARELYVRALLVRQRVAPESAAVAASLGALGRVTAENDSADDLCSRSLALWDRLAPDSLETSQALNDLGALYFQRGDVANARMLHERALAITARLDPQGLDHAASLYRLGNVAWRRGDLAAAEDFHRRALAIRQIHAPDGAAVEASLNSLGNVAGTRKDIASAQRYHRQALAIGEKRAPHAIEPMLHNLGEDARLLGDYVAAETLYRRALAMYERLPEGSGRDVATANTLVSLAAVARDRGDLEEAEKTIRRALEIREANEPGSLHLAEDREVLADILRERGRAAEARDAYGQILRTASRTVPGSELEARSLYALGSLDRSEGRTDRAAEMYRRAVDALDFQKGRLGGQTEAREVFSAIYADYYRDLLAVLVDLRRGADAFEILERSHARLLLAMLAERDLMVASNVPRELEDERVRADAEYDRMQRRLQELAPKDREGRAQVLEQLAVLRARRADAVEKIKRASPRYASLRYPQPLDAAVARASLDPGTLLLAYSIGKERSFLFALEPPGASSGLTIYELEGGDKAIREAVRAHRNLLNVQGPPDADVARNLLARSRSLYDTLIAPAEPLIARYERLLIVPDGPLHTLPFAALVRTGTGGKPQYLVEWRPLHTAVSATVYVELKKARSSRPRNPSVVVTAFGDPRYPKGPETKTAVRGAGGGGEEDDSFAPVKGSDMVADPQLRSVERGGFRFQPLPESRREVEEIASLYAGQSATYLGADATEERAKAIGRDVPLIHYACHAVVNEQFPLDSALVFSIPENPRDGQDNGLLQAWEIFEQMRIDADLVTLSACESGLGKEMGGEGLIGLTRAFQYAGARSVLASLWKVEDKSTAALMKRFYAYLKAGKTKDEALRLAQVDLIHSPDFAAPSDWAAFQLNGDWK